MLRDVLVLIATRNANVQKLSETDIIALYDHISSTFFNDRGERESCSCVMVYFNAIK